ncbi:hypothetical protein UFOVP1339_3 [uncultured Caudovirales phage]|uniref:Uncharacterized protein n=1 Tax=uncultured Caudovirales phage TaxID=2100421 RepID=A0A6J5RZ29_9CAUD|nr:hypothetical protein UFOVP1339_3 [uncultured Caudovirales phage]
MPPNDTMLTRFLDYLGEGYDQNTAPDDVKGVYSALAPNTNAQHIQGQIDQIDTLINHPARQGAPNDALNARRARLVQQLSVSDPDKVEHATFLPMAVDTQTGEKRWAIPGAIRDAVLGATDAMVGTRTGELTPRAGSTVLGGLLGLGTSFAPRGSLGVAGAKPPVKSASLPNLRDLSTADAVAVARSEPHLIPSADKAEGAFVGGPRNHDTRADLLRTRRSVDKGVRDGQEGGDWYDRYRAGVNEITGSSPKDNKWMAAQHGQWSAGVSPVSELQFVTKENNASVAGMPVKSARPAQHEAHLRAIEEGDPGEYQLGKKTGEYASKIEPIDYTSNQPVRVPGATGVNDFRWAREHGYTEPDGTPQKGAVGAAAHTFMDYETALAVDRANKAKLGGRSDWTGEQVQAAGWVRQKATDTLAQRPAMLDDRLAAADKRAAKEGMTSQQRTLLRAQARSDADAEAMAYANTTIADGFDKHQAFATHEFQPGADTGHLPGSVNAHSIERGDYGHDPRSTWATAPGGRDAIYSGLRVGNTGVAMRVRPTVDMQGRYVRPDGVVEYNPGQTARPLVAFVNTPDKVKALAPADHALLSNGEFLRGSLDAQNASAAFKMWEKGAVGKSNSLWTPMDRPLTKQEIIDLSALKEHGLPDIIDSGRGFGATNFEGGDLYKKSAKEAISSILKMVPGSSPRRANMNPEPVYHQLSDLFGKGEGSGAVTRELLNKININPQMRAAFDNNPYIAAPAGARIGRDTEWAKLGWGNPRKDIQTLRGEVASGPGWVGRVEAMLRKGRNNLPAAAPVVGGGLLGATYLGEDETAR